MQNLNILLFLLILFSTIISASIEAKEQDKNNYTIGTYTEQLCKLGYKVQSPSESKSQNIQISESVSLSILQKLSVKTVRGVKVASNLICQQLTGHLYTGSEQEWAKFLENAIAGLKKQDIENFNLIIVGGDEKVFKKSLSHKEYRFEGKRNGIAQTIYNVAFLDKVNNTVYVVSVSGADREKKAVASEYQRLIESLSLND